MIINYEKNTILAYQEKTADKFFSRLKGLLGTDHISCGDSLIIYPCNSVHTFGMNYPIDVLFVSEQHIILKLVTDMKPGKVSYCPKSDYVIELPAGTVKKTNTELGDFLVRQQEKATT